MSPTALPTTSPTFTLVNPPEIASCQLANDGSYFVVMFDISTDRGNFDRSHPCASTLEFSGNFNALCVWSDDKAVKVFPTGNTIQDASLTLIEIGNRITIKNNVLRAKCPVLASASECQLWLTASNEECVLTPPSDPVSPAVSISAPAVLSQCKSFVLDLTGSSGSGGRVWAQQLINVSSLSQSNTSLTFQSEIEAFFQEEYALSPPTALQAGYLMGNETYVFTVTLCNFLLQCHTSSTTVEILNMNALPIVTIAGSKSRQINRADALSFLSSAYVGTCNATNRFSGMSFQWEVSEDGVINQQLVSSSRNPFKFVLPGGLLSVGSVYTIKVIVIDTVYGGQSYSTVTVEVIPSTVIADIAGGTYQTWRVGETPVVLDGTGSYDVDIGSNIANQNLNYVWSCDHSKSLVSLVSSFCTQLLPSGLTTTSTMTLQMSFMDFNTIIGASFVISLQIDGSYNRSYTTFVSITITQSTSPKISVLSYPTKMNSQQAVQILTTIEVFSFATGVWSLSDNSIDLAAIASIPSLTTDFPVAGSYLFNMAIAASSLDAGSVYDFVLTVGGGQDSSSTRISVHVVEPPRSGELTVSPLSGSEMQDMFQFTTSRWTDDELPLSYAFGYFSGTAVESMLELQRRSESSFLGDKYLPRGVESLGFNLTCGMYAFNALDARSQRTFVVQILPVQVSAEDFGAAVLSQLEAVSDHQDTSAVKAIVSVGISILNAANCSLAPSDCGVRYGREACADTPHTCGSCLEGYLGENTGNSNSPCYAISTDITVDEEVESILVNGTCLVHADCLTMQTCSDGVCSYARKSCPADCSGKGRCQLELKASGTEVDECLINEFTCQARCICEEGFLGSGCSETRSAMEAKQETRYQFISYINSTMQTEDMTSSSVAAQIVLLMDLGSNPSELTSASCLLLQSIIDHLFQAAAEVDVSIDILAGLLNVLDNCDQVFFDATTINARRASDDSSSMDVNQNLYNAFKDLTSKAMIVGEKNKEFIDTFSRSTIAKNSLGDVNEQTIPQTLLENIFSRTKSSLWVDGVESESVSSTTRSVYLQENELNLYTNHSDFSANPLQVQYFLSASSNDDASADRLIQNTATQYVSVVFQNTFPQEYITNSSAADSSNSTATTRFITNCGNVTETVTADAGGDGNVHNYTCPGGQVVSHVCSEDREVFTSVCPALRRLPVCRILSSNENETLSSCHMLAYSTTNVTCNCSILLEQTSAVTVTDRQRYLSGQSSGIESSGYIEIVSMSEYTYEGFIETNSDVTEVTLDDLKSGLIVIIMFSSLWGCGLLGLYELFKSSYCSQCFAQDVQPTPTLRDRKQTDAMREISLDTKKAYLLKYIDEILPTIFRSSVKHDSILQSMWKTIKTYHPYAVVFTAQGPGAKELRIQKGIYLLTIQAMLMFIMAVFCDLQVSCYLRNICAVDYIYWYCFIKLLFNFVHHYAPTRYVYMYICIYVL